MNLALNLNRLNYNIFRDGNYSAYFWKMNHESLIYNFNCYYICEPKINTTMPTHSKPEVPTWALSKLQNYCAYHERCMMDVKIKLQEFHLQEDIEDALINKLIEDNYLDEERFARIFAGGKFRINKWGRNKIYQAMQEKRIPELYILEGLNSIEEEEYLKLLRSIIRKKSDQLNEPDNLKKNRKLANFAISKGFEQNLVWDVLNNRK